MSDSELPVERVDEYLDDVFVPVVEEMTDEDRFNLAKENARPILGEVLEAAEKEVERNEGEIYQIKFTRSNDYLKSLKNKKPTTADKVRKVYSSMSDLIDEKNKRYGDSVMTPLGVFSSHVYHENTESLNGVLIRLDDKLKRIKNSDELRKNDVSDLIGYLGFLCVEKGWENFDDLID